MSASEFWAFVWNTADLDFSFVGLIEIPLKLWWGACSNITSGLCKTPWNRVAFDICSSMAKSRQGLPPLAPQIFEDPNVSEPKPNITSPQHQRGSRASSSTSNSVSSLTKWAVVRRLARLEASLGSCFLTNLSELSAWFLQAILGLHCWLPQITPMWPRVLQGPWGSVNMARETRFPDIQSIDI